MKYKLALLFLFAFNYIGLAQNNGDSLFIKIRQYYQTNDHTACIPLAEKALKLLDQRKDSVSYLTGEINYFLGNAYDALEKAEKAIPPLKKAVAIFQNHPTTPDSLWSQLHFTLATSLANVEISKYEESLVHYEGALKFWKPDTSQYQQIFKSNILSNWGSTLNVLYLTEKSKPLIQEALNIRLKVLPPNHELIAKSYNQLASWWTKGGQWTKAIEYYEKGLEIFRAIKPADDFYIGALHHNMANIYKYQGKMQFAKDYFEVGRTIFEEKLGLTHYYTLVNLGQIAYCNYQLGNLTEAQEQDLLLLDRLIDKHGPIHGDVAGHYFDMANSLSDWSKDEEKTLEFYEKGLAIAQKVPMTDRIASGFLSYVEEFHDLEEGEVLLTKAMTHLNSTNPTFTEVLMPDYYSASLFYGKIKQNKKALAYLLKIDEYIGDAVWVNKNFGAIPRPIYALYAQIHKGTLYQQMYEESNQIAYLDTAELVLNQGLELLEFWVQQYSEESSQLFLQKDSRILFEALFKNQLLLHPNTKDSEVVNTLFKLAERSRATVLLQSVFEADAHEFANIPDELVAQEQSLKDQLLYNEKEYFYEKGIEDHGDSLYLQKITTKLRELRAEKKNLEKILRTEYPDFYALKNIPEVVSLPTVQENLNSNQALIEYFVGDNEIYALVVEKERTKFVPLPSNEQINKRIQALRTSVRSWSIEEQTETYLSNANFLYNLLIAPLGKLPNEIIIIPDAVLSYLPFELLLKSPAPEDTDFRKLDYLLNSHSISYNAAATLWERLIKKETENNGWIGFGPSFTKEQPRLDNLFAAKRDLGPLLFNQSEIETIAMLTNGKAEIGTNASKGTFLEKSPRFANIHIASHAKLEDQNPNFSFLAFSPEVSTSDSGRLYVNEIYNLDLHAEMVVLSACETGLGKFREGEGLLSLSRAFIYAGAKSLVTSLWSVNDKATADIMTNFYEQLDVGLNKTNALRLAKQEYLSNCLTSKAAHPYYWAGFIASGDMQPIDFQRNKLVFWFLSISLFAGIFIFFQKKPK